MRGSARRCLCRQDRWSRLRLSFRFNHSLDVVQVYLSRVLARMIRMKSSAWLIETRRSRLDTICYAAQSSYEKVILWCRELGRRPSSHSSQKCRCRSAGTIEPSPPPAIVFPIRPHRLKLGTTGTISRAQFRDFTLKVPDSGQDIPGISVFNAQRVLVENVDVQDSNGQALYSYMSKDVTLIAGVRLTQRACRRALLWHRKEK